MDLFFKYITPATYLFLVIIWSYIFVFYLKKINRIGENDKFLKLLLLILTIDAFRTLFESIYFGAWYTSLSGLLPIEIFNYLAKPQIVFFPKIFNLIAAILVLTLLIKKWLPSEIIQKDNFNLLIKNQLVELRVALTEAERSEFLLNEAGKMAKIGAWEFDLTTQKTRWSDQVFELHGIPIGEVPDFDYIMSSYIDGSEEKLRNAVDECIIKGTIYELELRFQNARNEKLWVQATGYPLFNTNNEIYGIRGVVQDITEQKKAEEELRNSKVLLEKSKYQLETITNNLPGAIIQYKINPDGTDALIFVSEGSIQIWGIKPELAMQNNQLIWQQIDEQCINEVKKSIELSYKSLSPWNVEFKNNLPNGSVKWIQGIGTPQKMKDGSVVWDSIMLDVTKKKQAETKNLEYQKSLQSLTTEISLVEEKQRKEIAENIHDHLSPSLVISKMKLKEFIKKNDLTSNSIELNAVVNHLSDAIENSRKITYDLCPPVLYELGLIETMYWLADKLQNEQPLIVSFETNQEYIKLSDEHLILIFRTIQELITNILKHAKATKISVVFNIQPYYFEIEIADDGVGFDGNLLNKFEKNKSGFGLFSIKERIRNLDGTIIFDTEIGKGTRVKIEFPLSSK